MRSLMIVFGEFKGSCKFNDCVYGQSLARLTLEYK